MIVLSLAPMVASTVANGPSSPWDAISLIITLRIWRVKRIIDGKQNPCTVFVLFVSLLFYCLAFWFVFHSFLDSSVKLFYTCVLGNGKMDGIKNSMLM